MSVRINTITTEYDLEEDRIRLAVADEAGQRRALWLTRRLGIRLVIGLVQAIKPPDWSDVPSSPAPTNPSEGTAPDDGPGRVMARDSSPATPAKRGDEKPRTSPDDVVDPLDGPNLGTSPQAVTAAQMAAQLKARLVHRGSQPVRVDETAAQHRIKEIKLSALPDEAVLITMICADSSIFHLPMKGHELRRWLEVLKVGFDRGSWTDPVWPAWLLPASVRRVKS